MPVSDDVLARTLRRAERLIAAGVPRGEALRRAAREVAGPARAAAKVKAIDRALSLASGRPT